MNINKRHYTFILSTIVLIGFLITSLVGYYVAKNSLTERLQQEMLPLTSDNIYTEIQRDLLQPLLISSLMANDVFVFDWVKDGEHDSNKMTRYLTQIQKQYDTITAFFVSDQTKRYYHPSGVLKTVDETNSSDAWYFSVKEAHTPYQINIDTDTADTSRLTIFVNYQVIDKSGDFIGVIGVGLSLKRVSELIENYQQRYGREIFFIDRQGNIMLKSSHYNDQMHIQSKAGLNKAFVKILTSPSASIAVETDNHNTIYLNSRLVPEFDWYLIVEQINDPASDSIETALWVNLSISLLISVLVLATAHFAIRGYHGRLETMAIKDKLTGAASRQVFDTYFKKAVANSRRHNESLSIALIDIDHFKQVNDRFGHQAGDEVITRIADIISSMVRENDVLCRWGGEEFLLMLTDCDIEKATHVLNKIRVTIVETVMHFNNQQVKITISAGIAQLQSNEQLGHIVERADHYLYQAKNSGRNCVRGV